MECVTDAPFYSWCSGSGGDCRNHFTCRNCDLELIKLLKRLNCGRGGGNHVCYIHTQCLQQAAAPV